MVNIVALGKVSGIISFTPYDAVKNTGIIGFKLASTIKKGKSETTYNVFVEKWGTEEQSKQIHPGQLLLVSGTLEENLLGVTVLRTHQAERVG